MALTRSMGGERAVSSVIGVVMILAITIAAVSSIMLIGALALQTTEDETRHSQMETSMAQMSSKASLPALGSARTQRFDLGTVSEGSVRLDPTAGNVTIRMENETDSIILANESLGAVIYEDGDTKIAYQGGGVWRATGNNGGEMVSPPEYHYLAETLTFPIIQIQGEETSRTTGAGTITAEKKSQVYPNETWSNPVDDYNVTVEVESEFYRGWYEFFDSRTSGDVDYDDERQVAEMELTVPFDEGLQEPLVIQEYSGASGPVSDEDIAKGENRQSPSSLVNEELSKCSGEDTFGENDTYTGEYYCAKDDVDLTQDVTFDNPDNTVSIAVDGDLHLNDNIDITDNTSVNFFVTGDILGEGGPQVNTDGDPDQLIFYIHTDGGDVWPDDARFNGDIHAIIYAPNSDVNFHGGVDFTGAVIADTVDFQHQNIDFQGGENLDQVDLGLPDESDDIRYLHITVNTVKVELD